ncbi:MAG: hypothetical protein J6Y02_21640 [Pseudobutyrivibrio sp.]|nr:hypothetical protein [Pseudobutyrivibrio sp.]
MNKELILNNAKLIYSDFRGWNTYLNGGPSIGVRIDGRKAGKIKKDGWNVKMTYIKGNKVWFIPVATYIPSNSNLRNKFNQKIDIKIPGFETRSIGCYEDRFKFLDYVSVESCNLTIVGYHWNTNYPVKREGIKAYLKIGEFTINRYIDAAVKVFSVNKEKI